MANQYDTNLKLQAIADAIGDSSSSGLIQALEDISDAVAGGGGGGSSTAGLVSDNFSETDTYELGDFCIHNNTLYVCINAITTPGPWDLSDWQATNAGLELSSLNSAIAGISDVADSTSITDTTLGTINLVLYNNGIKYISIQNSNATTSAYTSGAIVPAKYRAKNTMGAIVGASTWSNGIPRRLLVGNNGVIQLSKSSENGLFCSGVYI